MSYRAAFNCEPVSKIGGRTDLGFGIFIRSMLFVFYESALPPRAFGMLNISCGLDFLLNVPVAYCFREGKR